MVSVGTAATPPTTTAIVWPTAVCADEKAVTESGNELQQSNDGRRQSFQYGSGNDDGGPGRRRWYSDAAKVSYTDSGKWNMIAFVLRVEVVA